MIHTIWSASCTSLSNKTVLLLFLTYLNILQNHYLRQTRKFESKKPRFSRNGKAQDLLNGSKIEWTTDSGKTHCAATAPKPKKKKKARSGTDDNHYERSDEEEVTSQDLQKDSYSEPHTSQLNSLTFPAFNKLGTLKLNE